MKFVTYGSLFIYGNVAGMIAKCSSEKLVSLTEKDLFSTLQNVM